MPHIRTSNAEYDELFIGLMRDPELLSFALQYGEQLLASSESPLHQLWLASAMQIVHDVGAEALSARSIRSEMERRIGQDPDFLDDEGLERFREANNAIDAAFAVENPPSHRRSLALLHQVLIENVVTQPLQNWMALENFSALEFAEQLEEHHSRLAQIEVVGAQSGGRLSELWEQYERWTNTYKGRELLGLRTGLAELDRRTMGLRDVVLLTAGPGDGKTTVTMQIGVNVCRHCQENDAVVLFLSLEMPRNTVMARIQSALARVDYLTVLLGSEPYRGSNRNAPNWYEPEDARRLQEAAQQMRTPPLSERLVIHDRKSFPRVTAQGLAALASASMRQANARRVLVVIDYLQVIDVPDKVEEGGTLHGDRYRVRVLQDALRLIEETNHEACVLAISESRKPPTSKDKWAAGLAELMGSARLGYAAGTVLLYGPMSDKLFRRHYCVTESESVESIRRALIDAGRAPVEFNLVKGRDGTHRGSWGAEFLYRISQLRELPVPRQGVESGRLPPPIHAPETAPQSPEPAVRRPRGTRSDGQANRRRHRN